MTMLLSDEWNAIVYGQNKRTQIFDIQLFALMNFTSEMLDVKIYVHSKYETMANSHFAVKQTPHLNGIERNGMELMW